MKWSPEADKAVRKAPFFVRKKVSAAVEEYVRKEGRRTVEQADVTAAKKQFLADMSRNIKGYQADTCFGSAGCSRQANPGHDLMWQVREMLDKADLLSFLKETVTGPLRYHHELRVALADCPNACSRPQIKDFGLIGA
ncbi:MAG: sulfite reductase, partial [Desulfosudaceae bacterium]